MSEHLKSAVDFIKNNPRQPTAVVFDLDSTLFCMKWRTEGIIKTAVQNPDFKKKFPEITEKILGIKIEPRDWALKDIFQRHGLDLAHPAIKEVQKFWDKYFFRNEYLSLDRPYEGSVEYVNLLQRAGGSVFYLTGRNRPNMGAGTLQSLKKWGFPLVSEERLILKPDPAFEDSIYKLKALKKLKKTFQTILFFENEPVILHLINERLPDIKMFWVNSAHSGKMSGPPAHIPVLSMNYSLPSEDPA